MGMSMSNGVMRYMPMLHIGLQVDQKCAQMMLAINMFTNIFLLSTKIQNYHLKYPNVLCEMSSCNFFFSLFLIKEKNFCQQIITYCNQ